MTGEVLVRRARPDDYVSVTEIVADEDLWDGYDYMPTLYHALLQTNNHVFYVAEIDNKVVSFLGARLAPDGHTAMTMAARTVKNFRVMGLNGKLFAKLMSEFPNIRKVVFDGNLYSLPDKTRSRVQTHYLWNFLVYDIPASKMADFKLPQSTVMNVENLSMSKCVELVKSGVCERFLRQFASDYIPSANGYWAPVQLAERDLLKLVKRSSNILVTYSGSDGQTISSLSYAESLLLNTTLRRGEVKLTVQYFGTNINHLVEHVKAHLNQIAAVTCEQPVGFLLNFPTCFDPKPLRRSLPRKCSTALRT